MLIDWFTVGAQVVNFLILVWLLKRFLYQPILRAMADRERHVTDRLREAETQKALAEKERGEWQRRTQEFESRQAALLQEAVAQANAQRQSLLKVACEDAEAARNKWRESLRSEQAALQRDLAERVQCEVFAITRKTLADLAGSGIEERMAELFVKRLQGLDDETKRRLAASLRTAHGNMVIRTFFRPPPTMQFVLQRAIQDALATESEIQFETVPDLIAGIELEIGGEKVSWSISNYLATLEQSVRELTARPETRYARTT